MWSCDDGSGPMAVVAAIPPIKEITEIYLTSPYYGELARGQAALGFKLYNMALVDTLAYSNNRSYLDLEIRERTPATITTKCVRNTRS